jgi:hypothetical protein
MTLVIERDLDRDLDPSFKFSKLSEQPVKHACYPPGKAVSRMITPDIGRLDGSESRP